MGQSDDIGKLAAPDNGIDRENFLNSMVGALCETIEDVVGIEEAEAFIGLVGRRIGNSDVAQILDRDDADPRAVAEHLKAFKARIGGDFRVESVDGSRIEFSNCRCPFGAQAEGRPSLCMMTTNVFGRIAANATGYARVSVRESISRGQGRCLVSVQLAHTDDEDGQEFFG
ncbi:transcriptional regulator [Primorskyibacter flagellatus]|uniref:Transcriptional regulator n=1 Tax=Primorskyibacter flagellatus TaxID=1387277 RepID=A0A916ZW42_9RHOB|nr:methanogen output domain 1-containing protein [Primorskyibacter flagellatus]GGE16481.1 transcriptional regulator [Primorskyibacter flagellatus]